MSTVGGGVNIVRDGLVMYLDASNTKSLADVPSQNLFTYSQDISTVSWSKVRATITGTTSATTAPDGTYTAQKLIEDTTTGATHCTTKSSTISGTGTTYTVSIYAKAAERTWLAIQAAGEDPNYITAYFDLINGVLGSVATGITAAISNAGNGWYRCSITRLKQGTIYSAFGGAFCISPTNLGFSYNGDGTSGIYLWGGQLEVGSVATTYIPTTTVPVSRIPTWIDVSRGGNNGTLSSGLTYNYSNGGSLVFNPTTSGYTRVDSTILKDSGGTINVWCYPTGVPLPGLSAYIVSTIGTNSDRFYINHGTSGAFSLLRGNPVIGFGTGNLPLNAWYNLTMTWTNTSVSGYLNGIQLGVTTSYTASGTTSNFAIGSYSSPFGTQLFTGNIPQVSIYNRALSASEVLQNYNATKSKFGL
jgi:hypothetical protein